MTSYYPPSSCPSRSSWFLSHPQTCIHHEEREDHEGFMQKMGWTGPTLKPEIDELIDVRRRYAGGGVSYLHADSDLLIVQRNGHATKPGCILTLNDHDSSPLSTSVAVSHTNGTVLVDVLDTNHTATVSGGTVTLEGPSRGYRVYVNQDDL